MSNGETKYPPGIRQVTAGDIDAIAEIEKRCFTGPIAYSKRQLAYLALDANGTCLIEIHDNTIRGFIIVGYRKGSLTGRIETIDVDPRFQNQGVGIKLLTTAEADMRRRGMKTAQLEVSERNERALELYRKAGYTFKEKLEGYYLYDHDETRNAIRMIKSL
jgi:ribosomal protein S18 acetylase RimI-like enzyme